MLSRLLVLCALLLSAPAAWSAPLKVVASFTILADLVQQVGGERVEVLSLVAPGSDAHAFQPRPSDARRLADARLLVVNGLGFDSWAPRLAASASFKGDTLVLGEAIQPLAAEEEHAGHGHHAHGPAGRHDPHAWQDVANARQYAARIQAALIRLDPAGRAHYEERGHALDARLARLDQDIHAAIDALPAERRKVVSSHDAFGYFARSYGLHFLAPAGLANNAEASAAAVSKLIRQLRSEKVPVVFLENVSDQRLIQRIQQESGARLGGTLYSDALSPAGGPAPTYEAMMRHNLQTLMSGLQP